jgi:peptidoglycan/LPS O-acetylase OafA/YrhL
MTGLTNLAKQTYRPDIDGLRAVAVVLVIAYHLQTIFSHGGFIGVDIFFVISGFLITSILIRDLDQGRYSITEFYVRRIRRIAPALLVVFAAITVAAYFLLLPQELMDYARSLLCAVFSVSNFYFWNHSGYFDAQATTLPLLHTWSLAVEEQFYILFPLFLAFLHKRWRKRIVPVLAVCALIFFAISAWTAYSYPNFAFYWPISRAWELLCGSLLALTGIPGMQHKLRRNAASACGMLLILFGLAKYWHYTTFPGIAALAPCLGSVLIIGAGSGGRTVVGRILSWRPIVFLGLISYSLYLWHWPVIVFGAMGVTVKSQSKELQEIITFAVCVALATLSWRFVERPFRSHKRATAPWRVFATAAWCAGIPVAAACAFLLFQGAPSRFSAGAVAVASYMDHGDSQGRYRTGSCFLTSNLTIANLDQKNCLHESEDKPNVLVFGDSHAAHLQYGLTRVFPRVNFMQATAVSCTPIVQRTVRGMMRPPDCLGLIDFVLHDYLPKSHVKVVILGGHWADSDIPDLTRTIQYIQALGITPVLVGPAIEYDAALPRLLAFSIQKSDPIFAQKHLLTEPGNLDREMARRAKTQWHVRYFSYFDALCSTGTCQEYATPGIPVEEDQAHITGPGSLLVANKMKEEELLP